MTVQEYQIVSGDKADVTVEVNRKLAEGWKLQGGISLDRQSGADAEYLVGYAQAIYREVTKYDSGNQR